MFDFRGPLFFGQALRVADAVKALDPVPRVLILRMREVPLIDATATAALDDLATACRKAGCRLVVSSLQPQPRIALHRAGFLRANKVILAKDGFEAVAIARKIAAR
jgi:SulP family sulfate permease